ncbi:hypothetical protein [Psychroserpens luteus]|uniref:Uncharacterized protein n=1 Tax=Psychroserpens luteus TaxID=1434066 RepID=A0ABW5ZWW0_9FLAO|nr:hypothetical protein [Psychroserpens luteus]
MNKILILLHIFISSAIYSQDNNYVKLPGIKVNSPTIIVENNIIANKSFLDINEKEIKNISVLVDKPNKQEHKFYNLTENGIVFVSLNIETDYRTQSELNRFFGFKKNNEIYVNGYLLESSNYKIASNSISKIDVVIKDVTNKTKVLNVWTISEKEGLNGCKK